MVFERDAKRYLAGRHALRSVLSQALGQPPEDLCIEIDAAGKPWLPHDAGLQFNLSHSEHFCLIATGPAAAIGVDVEVVRPVADAQALAEAHFSAAERDQWAATAVAERDRAFLGVWTRKEACLKALGVGLSAQPSTLDVSRSAVDAEVAVPLGSEHCETQLCALTVEGDVVAALAMAEPSAVARARRYFQAS